MSEVACCKCGNVSDIPGPLADDFVFWCSQECKEKTVRAARSDGAVEWITPEDASSRLYNQMQTIMGHFKIIDHLKEDNAFLKLCFDMERLFFDNYKAMVEKESEPWYSRWWTRGR